MEVGLEVIDFARAVAFISPPLGCLGAIDRCIAKLTLWGLCAGLLLLRLVY